MLQLAHPMIVNAIVYLTIVLNTPINFVVYFIFCYLKTITQCL
jgi:hypothetical protein